MSDAASQHPMHVVVVGGGVAGLEALMALRDLAEHRVELTLVAPGSEFVYTPLLVGEPFGAGHARRRALAPIARRFGARFVQQPVIRVEPDRHAITLADGEQLAYDALLVCVGAQMRPAYRHALTFDAGGGTRALNAILTDLEGGYEKQVTFFVPTGATWPLPLYELALMTERHVRSMGREGVRCTIVTPEAAPLAIFGTEAASAVAALLAQRGIDVIPGTHAHEDGRGGFVLTPGDRRLPAGPAVALPVPHGPRIRGLPSDDGGFIPTDEHSRVRGIDDVYAAGDGTSFPIKQGGIATQQADAAAEH
ncbi:MAG: FAD-dependent oxidoreductase, partial [Solirubrobacteraceae bacterium]